MGFAFKCSGFGLCCGFRLWGLGLSGLGLSGLGFWVGILTGLGLLGSYGLGFWVLWFRFRVWGFAVRALCLWGFGCGFWVRGLA